MNCYCTAADVISRVASASGHEAEIAAILEAVSREIDVFCGRVFYVTEAEARDFDVRNTSLVLIDDCLSIDSVFADSEGDLTFDGQEWVEGTDFYLEPLNEFPKTRLIPAITRNYSLIERSRYLRITGDWGYAEEVPAQVKECALALAVMDWNLRGGMENAQERLDAYSHTRAGVGAREDYKRAKLAGLVRY